MSENVLRQKLRPAEPITDNQGDFGAEICKSVALAGLLQLETAVEARCEPIEPSSPAGFISKVWSPGLQLILRANDGQIGLLSVNADMAGAIGDILTGDLSDTGSATPRPPTATDASLCRGFLNALLRELADQAKMPVAFEVAKLEPDPSPHSFPDIRYISATLSLDFAEGARRGKMTLNLPANSLPDSTNQSVAPPADPQWLNNLEAAVVASRANLSAVLHRKHLPIGQIMRLKAGDTIDIPASALETLSLESAKGGKLVTARLGEYQEMRAAKIIDVDGAQSTEKALTFTP